MSFETPSDRFAASARPLLARARRLLVLETYASTRLIRAVWVGACIYYLVVLIMGAVAAFQTLHIPGATWETILGVLVGNLVSPVLSMLLISVVLAVCERVARPQSQPSDPDR